MEIYWWSSSSLKNGLLFSILFSSSKEVIGPPCCLHLINNDSMKLFDRCFFCKASTIHDFFISFCLHVQSLSMESRRFIFGRSLLLQTLAWQSCPQNIKSSLILNALKNLLERFAERDARYPKVERYLSVTKLLVGRCLCSSGCSRCSYNAIAEKFQEHWGSL